MNREVLPDLFFVLACPRVDVAHEESGRDAAGEVGFVGGKSDDLDKLADTRGMM